MSDEKTMSILSEEIGKSTISGKMGSKFKTLCGTLAGLLSGAFMMYVSPLITKVIEPAKPVANFGIEANGMTVTFYNQSTGGSEGWLDYGDGSPLEPVSAKQMTLTHTYLNPDSYLAKLTWRNLLGDENERSVKIELEKPKTEPPAIVALEANPICPGAYAPATFHVVTKLKNAQLSVWDCGDDRKLEFASENLDNLDRLVTFQRAGGYMVKVAAVNGEQAVERSTIVYVDEPPPGMITAILTLSDQGTRVDKLESTVAVATSFPVYSKEDAYRFDRQVPAKPGYSITDAKMEIVNNQGVRNLDMKIAPDKQSIHVTGELVKESGLFKRSTPPPSLLVRVKMTQEREVPDKRAPVALTGTIPAPGSILVSLPPLPATWINAQRQLKLELREGDRVAWQEAPLPRNAPVTLQNRHLSLTATPQDSQVRVELTEASPSPPVSTQASLPQR
jgi:hypothetical protein